jgi:uncharacterized protein (DUF2164 family)
MLNEGIEARLVNAIVEYIYEEGEGKLSMAQALGIVEFVKLQLIEDAMEDE